MVYDATNYRIIVLKELIKDGYYGRPESVKKYIAFKKSKLVGEDFVEELYEGHTELEAYGAILKDGIGGIQVLKRDMDKTGTYKTVDKDWE